MFRPKLSEPEVPTVNGDAPEFAAETANPPAAFRHSTNHIVEMSAEKEAVEDTAVADVIQIDKYQDCRSA